MGAETVRFAPSPTGWLHVGHAFSAWFAQARQGAGRFLLRIEDIDRGRTRPEFVSGIFEDLAWLGIEWEEPPLIQSERTARYEEVLSQLRGEEMLYPCFCTRAEVAAVQGAPHGPVPRYPGTCRRLSKMAREDRMAAGDPFCWRLNLELAPLRCGPLLWHDRRWGTQSVPYASLSDPVLSRKDVPTSYHLSSVTDDADTGVSLITRGSELMGATHLHRILQAILGFDTPEYEHHSLVGDSDGQRLAKRDASTTLRSYRETGKSPDEVRQIAESHLIAGT